MFLHFVVLRLASWLHVYFCLEFCRRKWRINEKVSKVQIVMKESDILKNRKTSDILGHLKNFQSSVLEMKAGSFT